MKGVFDPDQSSDSSSVFRLENGVEVTAEYSAFYGEFITRIDDKDGYWHCSSGLKTLPERFDFAKEWIDEECKNDLIRLKFQKSFPKATK